MNSFPPLKSTFETQLAFEQFKTYLKILPILATFLCFLSIALLLGSIYFCTVFDLDVFKIMAANSGLAVVLAICAIIWTAKAKSQQKKNKPSSGLLSTFIYQGSILVIATWIFCIILVTLFFVHSTTLIKETEATPEFSENISLLQKTLIGFFICCFLSFLCCGYIAYIVFMSSNPSDNNKTTLSVWALILIIFASAGIFYYRIAKNQGNYRIIRDNMNQRVLDFGFASCILAGAMVLIGYFINLGKWRRPYVFFGGAFIWVVIIALLAAGFNFRNANNVFRATLDNCSSILHHNHRDEIAKQGCQKYATLNLNGKDFFSENCKPSDLAIVWEDDKSKELSQKSRKFSCVNKTCCSKIIPNFSFDFFAFSSYLLGVFISGFFVLSSALVLSEKADLTKKAGFKDYLIGGLIAVTILVVVLLAVYNPPKVPQEKMLVIAAETQTEAPTVYKIDVNEKPSPMTDYPSKYCTLFSKLYSSFNEISNDLNSPQSSTYRLVIRGSEGKFRLPRDFNSQTIFRFTSENKRKFFPDLKDDDSFVAFQGKIADMKTFLEKDLKFCYSPDKAFSFKIHRYFKPDVSSTLASFPISENHPENEEDFENSIKDEIPTISFEDAIPAENWSKLYDSRFSHLIVKTVNVLGNSAINGVNLRLFKGIQPCLESKSEPLRMATSKSGQATFHNLANQHYTVFADVKGFKSNCVRIRSFQNKEKFEIEIPLLPEFTGKPVQILLQYDNNEAELLLHSVFNFNTKLTCSVSSMGKNCGGMTFSAVKNTQLVSFEKIGKYDYLFFLQRIPKKEEDKKVLSRYLAGENVKLPNGNSELVDSKATVKFFVENLIYPVLNLEIPTLSEEQSKDPNLIWLLGCMRGSVGPSTIEEISQFWSIAPQGTTPQYWNKEGQNYLPIGNICTNFYKSKGNN